MSIPILGVFQNSGPFNRFVIREWNGSEFVEFKGSELYDNPNKAMLDVRKILINNIGNVSPVRYVVPLFVDVYSHQRIDMYHVAEYLSKSATLQVDTAIHGNGYKSSLIFPTVDWRHMEPVKDSTHQPKIQEK